MENVKAVLFDLDGTVLDTYELIMKCFHHAAGELLPEGWSDEAFARTIGIPLPQQLELYSNGDAQLAADLTRAYRDCNLRIWKDYTRAFPETEAMLKGLANAGITLAIVTSKRYEPAFAGLHHCGLDGYFARIVGGDQGFAPKPAPDSLLACMDALGLKPEECVYVGDSPYDIQAGHAAGARAIGAAWGIYPEELLRQQGPESLCASPLEAVRAVLD